MTHIQLLHVKVHRGDQPELVAADVEDVKITNPVRCVKRLLERGEVLKPSRFECPTPQ
jgi:hypothetical protein